jgi:SAM-dependent methyltransferase
MNVQDRINRTAWSKTNSVDWLARGQGFSHEGERRAYFAIIDEVREEPILDLGVGPGRTIPFLRALTSRYVAIDYLPQMVEIARRSYPGTDIRVGDARDLSRFADGSFALVTFSFMGIDAVDHEGRQRVMREVHRVLKPGGIFWFSTLNKDGPATRERPWPPRWPSRRLGIGEYALELYRTFRKVPREVANYKRIKGMGIDGNGWSVGPLSAHAFGLLVHYTTLGHQLAELVEAGFVADPVVYGNVNGQIIGPVDSLRDEDSFNILARKGQV